MSNNELDLLMKEDLELEHGIVKDAAVGVENGMITWAKETDDTRGLL